MSEESLREFQLNGKQLVFLFMASTTVAVVIFLCGVMVGRGVTAAQAAAAGTELSDLADPTGVVEPVSGPPVNLAPSEDTPPDHPEGKDPLRFAEDLTTERPTAKLEKPGPASSPSAASGVARAPGPSAAPAASATTPPVAAKSGVTSNSPPKAAAATTTVNRVEPEQVGPAEPAGAGFVVQVAATPRRAEADAILQRLRKKGYPAFVTTSGRLFRVRVGKFDDRGKAVEMAGRLESEERFKPWVTR